MDKLLTEQMKNRSFKQFLLNESKFRLGEKIGDLLMAMQELEEEAPHLGPRKLIVAAKEVVDDIKLIFTDRWDSSDNKYLTVLQQIGVAISKAIEVKGGIPETIAAAAARLQEILNALETPINTLGSQDQPKEKEDFPNPLEPGTEL